MVIQEAGTEGPRKRMDELAVSSGHLLTERVGT